MKVVSPAPRHVWRELAAAGEDAVVYQTPEWVDACCRVGGFHDRSRLYELPERRLVLPLVSKGSGLGATLWSLPPSWGQAGILAPDGPTPEDVATVVADVRRLRSRVVIKPAAGPDAWKNVTGGVRLPSTLHVVDLRSGFDNFWLKRLSANARSKVRRAEKAGITINWDSTGKYVPVAWDLYLRWATNRATEEGIPAEGVMAFAHQRESLEQFHAAAALGDKCRIGVASVDGEPIAFMTLLVHGRHAHYWRGYSDSTLTRGRYPNQLLLLRLVEEAAKAGCTDVVLGKSGGVRSLEQFKESLGGEARSFDEFRFESPAVRIVTRLREASGHAAIRGAHALARARAVAGRRPPR